MFMKTILAIAFAATSVLAATRKPGCNEDNCLRALLNPTRTGAADCSSFFLTTVTPSVVTVTATASINSSVVTTASRNVTLTKTLSSTISTITSFTLTQTATKTAIYTNTTTVLQKRKAFVIAEPRGAGDFAKRQVTVVPSSLPAYATPCSGVVRFSSACSCLGVTASTVTASASTVTVTATKTGTAVSTVTAISTTETTITDLTTVVSTATGYVNVTTTTTSSAVATSTLSSCFKLQASGGTYDGQYAVVTFIDDGSFLSNYVYVFNSDVSAATQLSLTSQGYLSTGTTFGNTDTSDAYDGAIFYFNTAPDIESQGLTYNVCKLGADKTLLCTNQRFTTWQTCENLIGFGSGVVFGDAVFDTCTAFTFKAVGC